MQEVTAAGVWAVCHSKEALSSLAPLMQAAAVLSWYSVCKSSSATQTRRVVRAC